MKPTAGDLNVRAALAVAMHASPSGQYALLVGSGVSSGAGTLTGWQVACDLVTKIARARGVAVDDDAFEPEQWWVAETGRDLLYDELLAEVAPTRAARQSLLRGYFDPLPAVVGGAVRPSASHDAIAELVATDRVRVILTTNFDRHIERALDAAGVPPQVIARPSDVAGMQPLVHARATVIKMNGDYAALDMRNTPVELQAYSLALRTLVRTVFDQYGLIVLGWSAQWDTALASLLTSSPSRRYPIYWTLHKGLETEEATRLITNREARRLTIDGADGFLADLVDRITRIDIIERRRQDHQLIHAPQLHPGPTGLSAWPVRPLLHLRVYATIPATRDEVGVLSPGQRELMEQRLNAAELLAVLAGVLDLHAPALARVEPQAAAESVRPERWARSTIEPQSIDRAHYVGGSDGESGIALLFDLYPPSPAYNGSISLTLDIGISVGDELDLIEVAKILRAAFILLAIDIPEVITDLVPRDALVAEVGAHLIAPTTDGTRDGHGSDTRRPNGLRDRIYLALFGDGPPNNPTLMNVGARLGGPLTPDDAGDLAVRSLEFMALSWGWTDPRTGVAALAQAIK